MCDLFNMLDTYLWNIMYIMPSILETECSLYLNEDTKLAKCYDPKNSQNIHSLITGIQIQKIKQDCIFNFPIPNLN